MGTKTSHGLSHTQSASLSRYSTSTCPEGLTRKISTKQLTFVRVGTYLYEAYRSNTHKIDSHSSEVARGTRCCFGQKDKHRLSHTLTVPLDINNLTYLFVGWRSDWCSRRNCAAGPRCDIIPIAHRCSYWACLDLDAAPRSSRFGMGFDVFFSTHCHEFFSRSLVCSRQSFDFVDQAGGTAFPLLPSRTKQLFSSAEVLSGAFSKSVPPHTRGRRNNRVCAHTCRSS